jgi:hypothetical protein
MLAVFSQSAGRQYLNFQPDKLISQSSDAESAFEVIADCPKNGTSCFQFWNTPNSPGYTSTAAISVAFKSL